MNEATSSYHLITQMWLGIDGHIFGGSTSCSSTVYFEYDDLSVWKLERLIASFEKYVLASIKLLNVTLANYICSLNRSFAFVAIYVLPMWILNSLPQLNLFTSFLYLTERLCSLEHRLLSINTKSFVKISLNTIHLCFHFPGKNSSVGCHSTFMPPNKRWVWRCG